MPSLIVSIAPADGPAVLNASTSACKVMTKFIVA